MDHLKQSYPQRQSALIPLCCSKNFVCIYINTHDCVFQMCFQTEEEVKTNEQTNKTLVSARKT